MSSIFPTYENTRKIVIAAGINTVETYRSWYKTCPTKLPHHPQKCYRHQWRSWYEFFGKKNIPFVSYQIARAIVKQHDIRTVNEYKDWYKSVEQRLPSCPPRIYADQWIDWHIFFGFKTKYVPFEEAKLIIFAADIRTVADYRQNYRNLHGRFPAVPASVYSEWINWKDFLNKKGS